MKTGVVLNSLKRFAVGSLIFSRKAFVIFSLLGSENFS